MSKRKRKIQFIRKNQNLTLPELSLKTGLSVQEVNEIIEKLKSRPSDFEADESQYPIWIYALVPAFLAFLFYIPVFRNGFIDWDDPSTIINNPHIRILNLSNIQWMLTTFSNSNWTPMTWLSLAMDFFIGQLNPGIYHFTNLLIHTLNTLLVFCVCLRILRIWKRKRGPESGPAVEMDQISAAFLTAVLFGIHPLHVESVAWATERKDVLYAFFYLSAIFVYLGQALNSPQKRWVIYVCFGCFLLSLMSKPMAVSLPVVLIILDIWLLGRWNDGPSKVLIEKIPFFVVALLSGLIAIVAQGQPAFSLAGNLSLPFRLINAFRALAFYLWKIFLPFNLAPLYPFHQLMNGAYYFENILSIVIVLIISLICLWYRKKAPCLLAGWLYYFVTLAPVLGILQVGAQAAADRYTYLPSLGIFLPFSVGVSLCFEWFEKKRAYFFVFCAVLVIFLGYLTIGQISVWRNSMALWETVMSHYPNDAPQFAHKNLAAAYQAAGRLDDALREYDKAIAIQPPDAYIYSDRATVLFDLGKQDDAIQELKYAISLDPHCFPAHKNLAIMYKRMGMAKDAQAEMQEVLKLQLENMGH